MKYLLVLCITLLTGVGVYAGDYRRHVVYTPVVYQTTMFQYLPALSIVSGGSTPPVVYVDDSPPPVVAAGGNIEALRILNIRCFKCHSGESPKGGVLLFDRSNSFIEFYDRSKIRKVVASGHMPPNVRLPELEKELIDKWTRGE